MKKSTATEAIRVASEIAAIRAALKERGYHIQKQPKQAAWKVTPLSPPLVRGETNALNPPLASGETNALNPPLASGEKKALSPPKTTTSPSPPLTRGAGGVSKDTDEYYLLTYQPAPISAWVLHLSNNEPDCQIIETIIQSATKKQFANITRRSGR
jgi:hypothetical protein